MYSISKIGERQLMVSSVAPPYDKTLPKELRKLSVSHLMIAQGEYFTQFIPTLEALDTEKTEAARLQFLHFLNEVKDLLKADEAKMFQKIYHFAQNPNMSDVLNDMQADIIKATQKHIENLESRPKSQSARLTLENHLQYLSDFNEITHRLNFQLDLSETKKHYDNLLRLKQVYEELNDLLSWNEWMEKGKNLIIPQSLQDLNHKRERMSILCGDRTELWYYVQANKKEQKKQQQTGYQVLTQNEAKELKSYIVEMIKAFDFYMQGSALGTLFALKTLVDYHASMYQLKSDTTMSKVIEQDEQKQKEVASKQRIKQLLVDKKFQDDYAQCLYTLSNQIQTALNTVMGNHALVLRFEGDIEKDSMYGVFNQSADYDIKVEKIEHSDYPNAINLTVINKEKGKEPRMSSFISVSQMMEEMKDESVQKFFFDKTFIIENATQAVVRKMKQ